MKKADELTSQIKTRTNPFLAAAQRRAPGATFVDSEDENAFVSLARNFGKIASYTFLD